MAPTPRPDWPPPDHAAPVDVTSFTHYPDVDFSRYLIVPATGVDSEESGAHVAYLIQHDSRLQGWFISHRVFRWPDREHPLELVVEDPRRRLGDDWFQNTPPPRPARSPDRSRSNTPPQPNTPIPSTIPAAMTTTTANKLVLKGLEPPRYDGKSVQGCRQFLTAVSTYTKMAGIVTENERILMAMGRLEGIAAEWAEPYRANFVKEGTADYDSNFWFASWKEFSDTFIAAFGLKQDKEDATFKLNKLVAHEHPRRNIRPVRLYTQDFNLLAGRTKLSSEDKAEKYYGGLPDRTKRVLINRKVDKTKLALLQQEASEIDEEWGREFGLPQLKNQRQTVNATVNSAPVSAVVAANNSRTPGPSNVCFQCGEAGHFARDHMPDGTIRPFRPRPRPQQVAAVAPHPVPTNTLDALNKQMESLMANITVLTSEVQAMKEAKSKEDF